MNRLLLVFLFGILSGCTAEPSDAPTIQSWQQSVEKYVWDRGNGDPNVIADLSWDNLHKGFAVIGDPLPNRSTDQIGLLLGHKVLNGKPYFVFLLATVRRNELEGLRAVTLYVEGDAFHWTLGPEEPNSLSLYRAWSQADRRASDGPQDPVPPPFPRTQETFELTGAGDRFSISHLESGAHWEVRPLPTAATQASGDVTE